MTVKWVDKTYSTKIKGESTTCLQSDMNDNIDSNDTNQRRDRSAGQENLKS